MKITVIHGVSHHGSTWNTAQLVLREMDRFGENERTEFYLPDDMPHFCKGCYSCFLKGEGKCPHANSVQPIVDSLLAADIVMLTSPVYGMDVTGGMKALIDHLCYMWLSHRPSPEMFRKVGIIVTTTGGAGLSHTAKTMRNSLHFWGVKRAYTIKKAVAALKWEEVSNKTRNDLQKKAERIAKSAIKASGKIQKLSPPLIIRFLFSVMRGMQKKNAWNETDRIFWETQGWLEDKRPF
ncbi:MAG: NAD(P)H-dependent oxidoreductase [Eubacteriales bacterium]